MWEKIGIVNNDNWDIIEWRKSGIRNIELWSEEDWDKYGYSFNISDLWDKQWEIWISENWKDEEKRRLYNYVHKYFNTEGNVGWFDNVPELVFNKEEYYICIEKFK